MLAKMCALAVTLALTGGLTLSLAAEPQPDAANAAIDYIRSLQNADGGFPAFGEESTPGSTIDAVFALVAAGEDPTQLVGELGDSTADYLIGHLLVYAEDPGAAAKLALAFSVMGLDGEAADLLASLDDYVDQDTGAYGLDLFDECLYILALVAADEPVPEAVYQHLHSQRAQDGGWEFAPGAGSDSNTTALVVQALVAAGAPGDDHAVAVALGYLRTAQNDDGGFGFAPDAETDPNSTALAIQALVAAGANIDAGGRWDRNGNTPMQALLSFQNSETGAFQYAGEDSAFATYQAVPALMLAPFPHLQPPQPTPTPVPRCCPTATPAPTLQLAQLPSTGAGGPRDEPARWWIAFLLGAGAAAVASGAAVRRSR